MIFVMSNPGPFSVSVFFSGKNLPTKIRLRKHSNYESYSDSFSILSLLEKNGRNSNRKKSQS